MLYEDRESSKNCVAANGLRAKFACMLVAFYHKHFPVAVEQWIAVVHQFELVRFCFVIDRHLSTPVHSQIHTINQPI